MKVLWIIDSLGPGGAESLMPSLLQELKQQGVDSRVCVLRVRGGNPVAGELKAFGIPVEMVPVRNLRNPFKLARLVRCIRRYQPDVVHTQLETSDILGTLAAKLARVPSVSTIHTLETPSKKVRKTWRNQLRWYCLRSLSRRVIVVSAAARAHYRQLDFPDSHLATIHNGIDLTLFEEGRIFHPGKAALFGIPPDSKVLTTVAVLRQPKGIQFMLEALPGLVRADGRIHYIIVGDGEWRDELVRLANRLGVADHVVFMLYRRDIPQILAASDLFVYPTMKDALPTALLEAMAADLPIIASNVGGVPEILRDGGNSVLVPPADPVSLAQACLNLLSDTGLARKLADAGCSRVHEAFAVQRQAGQLIALYRQVGAAHA